MLNNISKLGWCYFTYGLIACGYFTAAAIGGWQGLDLPSGSGSGSSYSGGWSSGRSSGGSWGGGK
ncbi:MAG: hypothetical protein ACKV2Q_35490 [Planctomycetaceae bacterium]